MADRRPRKHDEPLRNQRVDPAHVQVSRSCVAHLPPHGTLPASPHTGTRQLLTLRAWVVFVISVLTSACVVLPPTADAPAVVPPYLKIEKDKVEPVFHSAVKVQLPAGTEEFRIVGALSTFEVDPALVRYQWYYDFDPTAHNLDRFATCGSKPTCTIFICGWQNNKEVTHRLLVVASTALPLENAVSPTDFAPGVLFDAVEWQIEKVGDCP